MFDGVVLGTTVPQRHASYGAPWLAGMIGAASCFDSLLSYGDARVERGRMPKATLFGARKALEKAGIAIGECRVVKTHNPFAVNDVFFCRELGLAPERVNAHGSPLVYGHPQAPTGLRLLIELVEELVMAGGGRGLFSGCAASDTAMALVVQVG